MISRRAMARHNRGRVGVASAAAPVDTPYSQGTLLTWLDANDLSIGTGTTWTDKSSAGNDGTFVASPTISDGWTGGRRMVTFNGTSQYLTVDGVASAISGEDKPYSVALVYQFTANAAAYYGLWAFNRSASATAKLEFYKINTVGGAFQQYNQDDLTVAASANAGTSGTSTRVLVCSCTGTEFSSWFNGTIAHNAAAANVGVRTLDLFTVGALRRGGVAGTYAPMRLCEVLVWSSAIGSAGAASEYAQLSAKWGV